jgi:hypothetical protein
MKSRVIDQVVGRLLFTTKVHTLMVKTAVRPAFLQVPRAFPHQFFHSHLSARVCRSNAKTNFGALPTHNSELTTEIEQNNNTEYAPRKTRNITSLLVPPPHPKGEAPCSRTDCDNLTPVLLTSTKYLPQLGMVTN